MHTITENSILKFKQKLRESGKSKATIEKYGSYMSRLMEWLNGRETDPTLLMEYRDLLLKSRTAATVNGTICAMNAYFSEAGMPECRLKLMKIQKKVFRSAEKEMTKDEYYRLLNTAQKQGKKRLLLIMETICAAGIRVSETKYITAEAVQQGYAEVTLKGKTRTIFIPKKLARKLKEYARKEKITSGSIFITGNGTPVSRKQIWAEMKALCEEARVMATKVFPHNLRHLFARCFYAKTHDVVKLADMMGHSCVETTRIYLISTGTEHEKTLESLKLVI